MFHSCTLSEHFKGRTARVHIRWLEAQNAFFGPQGPCLVLLWPCVHTFNCHSWHSLFCPLRAPKVAFTYVGKQFLKTACLRRWRPETSSVQNNLRRLFTFCTELHTFSAQLPPPLSLFSPQNTFHQLWNIDAKNIVCDISGHRSHEGRGARQRRTRQTSGRRVRLTQSSPKGHQPPHPEWRQPPLRLHHQPGQQQNVTKTLRKKTVCDPYFLTSEILKIKDAVDPFLKRTQITQ